MIISSNQTYERRRIPRTGKTYTAVPVGDDAVSATYKPHNPNHSTYSKNGQTTNQNLGNNLDIFV